MAEIIRFFDRDAATQTQIDEPVEHLVRNSLLALIREYGISAVMDAFDQLEFDGSSRRELLNTAE